MMMAKIGLIQIDGEMPNLALMKLSRYHKNKGDKVYLMKDKTISQRLIDFDKVYISCVFEENKENAIELHKQFKNAEIGGVGVNHKKLSDEIEHLKPDYELFKFNSSLGYATRGCIRRCKFCVVSENEGMIRPNTDIYEFWDKKHKHIILLDNNILASPNHFKKIAGQILKEGLSVDINQGLDIRLLNEDNVKILARLKIKPYYRFAFDSMEVEPYVLKGLKLLNKHGIKNIMWYVLVGFDTTTEQDFYRLNLLKELGQKPYLMRYKDCNGKKIYNHMAWWVNQYQFFKTMDFETFMRCTNDRGEIKAKIKLSKSQKTL